MYPVLASARARCPQESCQATVMTATHPAYSPVSYYAPEYPKWNQEGCGYPRSPWEWAGPFFRHHPLWSPPCKSPQILLLAQDTLGALALPGTGIKTNKAHAIQAPQTAPHPITLLSWLP